MTQTSLRDRLIQTLDVARERENVLLALCDDSPAPGPDRWSAKDNVAHLAAWREHAALTLDAVRLGEPIPVMPHESEIDVSNAAIYAAHRDDSASAVRAASRATYGHLTDAIRACTDDVLRGDRPGNAGPLWRIVPGNGHAHVAQHLSYWFAEHGDPAAAEAAAVWAHRLEVELFPEPEERAAADYNLACFHARGGHADRALPLLRDALSARPDLLPWAAEDVDLDPIRAHPEVQALLAG